MNHEEFGSGKLLKLKYRREDEIIQRIYKIGSPQKLDPPSLIYTNLKNLQKSTAESYKIHSNLMNDEEFGSKKLLKLKYRRGDQIIQTFCKIGSPQKLGPPSLICTNFRTLRKIFLIHAEQTKI